MHIINFRNVILKTIRVRGYNLSVYDDLKAVGMKNTTDVHVELVKLMDGMWHPDIPQHPIIKNQIVGGVKGGTVLLVIIGQCRVIQGQSLLTCLNVIDLQQKTGVKNVMESGARKRNSKMKTHLKGQGDNKYWSREKNWWLERKKTFMISDDIGQCNIHGPLDL